MLKYHRVNYSRLAKHIAAIAALSLAILLGASVFLLWQYEDRIIAFVISEINKKVDTEITVGKVDVSLKRFPDLSIRFSQVVIKGSINRQDTLLSCERMYCGFRFWNVFNQNYRIRQVFLENGRLAVKRSGQAYNYQILKKSDQDGNTTGLDIEKLQIRNFIVEYRDMDRRQVYAFKAPDIASTLLMQRKMLIADLDAELLCDRIFVAERDFARNVPFTVSTKVTYHMANDSIVFSNGSVVAFQSKFDVLGHVDKEQYHFTIEGRNTDVQTLLALLPEDTNKDLKSYHSAGQVFFGGTIDGLLTDDMPAVSVNFGSRNAQFYHPKYRETIKNVSLEGFYSNGKERNDRSSVLELKNITGRLNGRDFKGNFELSGFVDSYIAFDILADVDARSALNFFPVNQISEAVGNLYIDLQFSGRLEDMKHVSRLDRIKSSGEVNLDKVDFKVKGVDLAFRDFKGNFIFQDDAVAVSDFSGRISGSDFLINGFVRNGLAYLLFDNTPLIVEADLQSDKIMLTELLSGAPVSESTGDNYQFRISPWLDVDFNCKVDYLEFKRFKAEEISGQLRVKNQKASSREISFGAMGGRMSMNGSVNALEENNIEVFTATQLQRIDIDQLFYVFEEFGQDFLTSSHLKGQINASLNTFMIFDNHLRLATDKLISDISVSIKNGELNNFEPMKKLSKYVEEKSLERMRFSELRNQILVQNRNIYLPQMEVASNVSAIKVSGTHTFDQAIDYRVTVPLKRFNKEDKDERFGAIRDDGRGNLNLFLKIVGTTSDYKVAYDGEGWKENFKETVREEGRELKQIFQTKGKEPQQEVKELNEEEYFDF